MSAPPRVGGKLVCVVDDLALEELDGHFVTGRELAGLELQLARGVMERLVAGVNHDFQEAVARERVVAADARLDVEDKLRFSVREFGDLAVGLAAEFKAPEVLDALSEFRNDILQERFVLRNVLGEVGDEVLGSGLLRRLVHVEAESAGGSEEIGQLAHFLAVAAKLELHAFLAGRGLLRRIDVLHDFREVGRCGTVEGEALEKVALGLVLDSLSITGYESLLQSIRRDAVHVGSTV